MKVLAPLLLLVFTFETSAQTIADIARRERARQKQVQHLNKRTYTNATAAAPPKPVEAGSTAEATPEKKEKAAAQPTGPVDNQGRDEKFWRDAFQKARDELRRAEEMVQLTELRLKDLNTQLLRQSDIYNRENVLGPQIISTQRELDARKIEVEQARNKIANLEEDLRVSGGLPGWAR